MTQPKVATLRRGGSRFYVHPHSQEKVPGVTSVVDMLPKGFLGPWNAKLVAEHAVANCGTVVQMALNDPKGAVDWLKGAPRRNTSEAADTGSAVHDLCERIARGEGVGRIHPDLEGFIRGFQEFLDEFQPEYLHLEETVWSEAHRYAGSFDFIARIGGETILGDLKTTRSGVHEEVALQLTAYSRADYILAPDGSQAPLPPIDGAAVVHLRPEGWQVVPVMLSDEVFAKFLALREVFDWDAGLKRQVLGRPIGGRTFEEV